MRKYEEPIDELGMRQLTNSSLRSPRRSFGKVMTIMGSLSRVRENRQTLLKELGTVAESLGADALKDLTDLNDKLSTATKEFEEEKKEKGESGEDKALKSSKIPASALTLSTTSAELRLLRVLQSVVNLESSGAMLTKLDLTALWSELTKCLKFVSKLEGLGDGVEEGEEEEGGEGNVSMEVSGASGGGNDASGVSNDADVSGLGGEGAPAAAKLSQSTSAAALVNRFLPSIQSFFLLATTKKEDEEKDGMAPIKMTRVDSITGKQVVNETQEALKGLVGGQSLLQVSHNEERIDDDESLSLLALRIL